MSNIKMPIWPYEREAEMTKQQMWENGFKEGIVAYEVSLQKPTPSAQMRSAEQWLYTWPNKHASNTECLNYIRAIQNDALATVVTPRDILNRLMPQPEAARSQSVDDEDAGPYLNRIIEAWLLSESDEPKDTVAQRINFLKRVKFILDDILTRAGSSGDERTLPELPDGVFIYHLCNPEERLWTCCIGTRTGPDVDGEGPTPREAVEAAIRKIKS